MDPLAFREVLCYPFHITHLAHVLGPVPHVFEDDATQGSLRLEGVVLRNTLPNLVLRIVAAR